MTLAHHITVDCKQITKLISNCSALSSKISENVPKNAALDDDDRVI